MKKVAENEDMTNVNVGLNVDLARRPAAALLTVDYSNGIVTTAARMPLDAVGRLWATLEASPRGIFGPWVSVSVAAPRLATSGIGSITWITALAGTDHRRLVRERSILIAPSLLGDLPNLAKFGERLAVGFLDRSNFDRFQS